MMKDPQKRNKKQLQEHEQDLHELSARHCYEENLNDLIWKSDVRLHAASNLKTKQNKKNRENLHCSLTKSKT